jgi:DNA-binding NarL/FixJ family response regulator
MKLDIKLGRPAVAIRKLSGKEEEIIRLLNGGETQGAVAKRFKVSRATIGKFIRLLKEKHK